MSKYALKINPKEYHFDKLLFQPFAGKKCVFIHFMAFITTLTTYQISLCHNKKRSTVLPFLLP